MKTKAKKVPAATSKVTPAQLDTQIVLKALEKEARPLMKKLEGFKIKSNEDYAKALELTKDLKDLGKRAKSRLDEIVVPIKKSIKLTEGLFKPFQDQVAGIEAAVKISMLEYQNGLDRKKVALEEAFESGDIKKSFTFMRKHEELEVSDAVRKVWKAVPINPSLTPREFLIPDEAKIREALKAGKKVKGWEWKQEKTIAI